MFKFFHERYSTKNSIIVQDPLNLVVNLGGVLASSRSSRVGTPVEVMLSSENRSSSSVDHNKNEKTAVGGSHKVIGHPGKIISS